LVEGAKREGGLTVAETREQLEQQAMVLLQKEKTEEALDVYLKILKLSKGDIRVRQKLADLYLALDKKPEAIRQLRDVAKGQIKDGQHRVAVVVLKKLHELNPTDIETLGQLARSQKEVGFGDDAKVTYTLVIDMLDTKPREALPYVNDLIALSPGEIPPKVKLAEVLFSCGQTDEAFGTWIKLGREACRRGNMLDQALFLERGLKIKDEDVECLEGAAEARIALGAPKEALVHIQKAYAINPNSTRVLSMLAQCFEVMEQQPKAKKVLMQLATIYEENNELVERLEVLKRAAICDPKDTALNSEVGAAVVIAEMVQMRIHEQDWSKAKEDDEGAVVIRAAVLARYGFLDRAKTVLEDCNGLRQNTSVRALLAEVHAELGEVDSAIAEMKAIEMAEAQADIQTRVLVLQEKFNALKGDADPEEDFEMEISMDEEESEEEAAPEEAVSAAPDAAESEGEAEGEAEGDRLAAAGDKDAAIAAYQKALENDPSNESVLMKLGELFASTGGAEPVNLPMDALQEMEPAAGFSGFESFGDKAPAQAVTSSLELDPAYLVIRGQIMLGKIDAAQSAAEARDDLLGACALAEILANQGDVKQARRVLQEKMDDVDEDAPGFAEGLWGLARTAAMLGKARTTARLLREMEALAPGHRAADVSVLRAGMGAKK
jgi:tetratricopeptide (TPR) repeat protein